MSELSERYENVEEKHFGPTLVPVRSAHELLAEFERRRTQLGGSASGLALVREFFALARVPVDGYLTPDSEDDVVRVEANSGPDDHAVNFKRQLTWLDDENDPGFTFFYLDMSFERQHADQPLSWVTINYTEPRATFHDLDRDAVARHLQSHDELQRILARTPLNVSSWVEGDVLDDF